MYLLRIRETDTDNNIVMMKVGVYSTSNIARHYMEKYLVELNDKYVNIYINNDNAGFREVINRGMTNLLLSSGNNLFISIDVLQENKLLKLC